VNRRLPFLLALCAAFAVSCTRNAPYRLASDGQALESRVEEADLTDPARRARVASSSVEIHDDYKLLFTEFDDQGQAYSTESFRQITQTLQTEAQAPDKPRLAIVLFAHGWKNNASVCNRNVCCFRAFLSRLAADMKVGATRPGSSVGPMRVIGIFVGWRGLPLAVPVLETFSFYGRKHAATNIG